MRKELIIYIDAEEQDTEVDVRLSHDTSKVCIGYEGMRFVVSISELREALSTIEQFEE